MAVEMEIFARNLDVTDRIRDYVEKKVTKLDRYLPDVEDARVDLSFAESARSQADRYVAQVTLRGRGFILRSEERADDIFTAIDKTLEKLQRQIERFKGKRTRSRDEAVGLKDAPIVTEVDDEESTEPVIARRKQFTLIPMDEQEAIEQMSLLGHDNFFIFYNVDSASINVLYTRRDGSYGLIEPKIG